MSILCKHCNDSTEIDYFLKCGCIVCSECHEQVKDFIISFGGSSCSYCGQIIKTEGTHINRQLFNPTKQYNSKLHVPCSGHNYMDLCAHKRYIHEACQRLQLVLPQKRVWLLSQYAIVNNSLIKDELNFAWDKFEMKCQLRLFYLNQLNVSSTFITLEDISVLLPLLSERIEETCHIDKIDISSNKNKLPKVFLSYDVSYGGGYPKLQIMSADIFFHYCGNNRRTTTQLTYNDLVIHKNKTIHDLSFNHIDEI